MTTIKGFLDNELPEITRNAYAAAIYSAFGDELSNEIKNSTCELIIDIEKKTYKFENCPPDIDHKISAKEAEIKESRTK